MQVNWVLFHRFKIKPVFVFIFSLWAAALPGQVKNKGIPHIINYPKQVYEGGTQNWSITQDQKGFMYFGNNDGLLEFDGKRWRRYSLSDRFLYRAVAVTSDGTIYIGLSNDFGMMIPDERGILHYVSLSDQFPRIAVGFNEIWKIFETPAGIYFQSKSKIFLYKGNQMDVIFPDREFNFLFKADKTLYTSERHLGLLKIQGTQVSKVPGGDAFIGMNIESVVPYDDRNLIIGTAKNGLFLYDGEKAVPWAKEASAFLMENSIFCGIALPNRYYAYGTIRDGVLIIDKEGRPIQHLNQSKGLQNNTVLSLFSDRDNNLWLGLDRGISYAEINSPITFYNYGKSLPGTGYVSILADGNLYAGTNQGLFLKKWSEYENPLNERDYFSVVPGTQGQVWSLKMIDKNLFCGHNLGTFLIRGTEAKMISEVPGSWDFLKLSANPGIVLGGTYTGVNLYTKSPEGWKFSGPIAGFHESTRLFAEDDLGRLWIAHGSLGVFRVEFNEDYTTVTSVKLYTDREGLPSKYRNSVYKIGSQILFTTINGIYYYDQATDSFMPDLRFNELIGKEPVSSLYEDKQGNIWYFKPSEMGIIRSGNQSGRSVEKRPFYPLRNQTNRSYEHVNFLDENNIIIACEEGYAHYDPTYALKLAENAQCHIRAVIGTGKVSTTYLGGNEPTIIDASGDNQKQDLRISIPFSSNNLRFEFAVPLYDHPDELRFKYYLEGYDDYESAWTTEAFKEYTGLKEGSYLFRVKGLGINNIETSEASVRFRVLPPWFRSTVAYVFYILVLLSASFLTGRRILHKFQQEKLAVTIQHEKNFEQIRQRYLAESLESEKRLVVLEKDKLETEMAFKNKQLSASISGLVRKNEFLIMLRKEMIRISEKLVDSEAGRNLNRVIAKVEANIEAEADYRQFEDHFDAVHDNFLKNLKKQFPQLTPTDLRLCAYLRLNLTTKEIAPLLNISPRGVEISRYRLRKKMNLPHDLNLTDFMINF